MKWFIEGDTTPAVITAQRHIGSRHGDAAAPTLPGNCVLFELGMAMRHIQAEFPTKTLTDNLPGFINNSPCVAIEGIEGVCFANGGYGAPAAVDTVETLYALGVHTIILVGMCGGFTQHLSVSDVIIPHRIKSEEGTSWHYVKDAEYAYPDNSLHNLAVEHFRQEFPVYTDATVTTDAVYRQTFAKEYSWRDQSCVGVDMESSAVLTVARVKSIRAVALLIVSDKHPANPSAAAWDWGDPQFKEKRKKFIDSTVAFAASLHNV